MTENEELKDIDEKAQRKRKRWTITILVIVAFIVGGTAFMIEKHNEEQKQEHEYMVKVVKSNEARTIFEKEIKDIDPNAFMDSGFIKNYSIDYKSVTHNPMGGIDVRLTINNNNDLNLEASLVDYNGSSLESGGSVLSKKLSKLQDKTKEESN